MAKAISPVSRRGFDGVDHTEETGIGQSRSLVIQEAATQGW